MAFESTFSKPRIAVIGGGVSGLGAAFALKDVADVVLLEKRGRLGGHACTQQVDYDGENIDVDIGFIVCNDLNYPNFIALMNHLNVDLIDSDMSFSVSTPGGFEWASDPRGLFAWKRNAANPKFWRLLQEIFRFNKAGRADALSGRSLDMSLGDYLDKLKLSASFKENYLQPMGAAIWSTPEKDVLDYPASSFIHFFQNHRLMHLDRPTWRTVKGGSQCYVEKLTDELHDVDIRLNSPVSKVEKTELGKVILLLENGRQEIFDHVILAGHSDQSRDVLSTGFERQKAALQQIRYAPNKLYLHRDPSFMPKRRSAWASWNVLRHQGEDVCVTYWMNRLQDISSDTPLFVTLNPSVPPKPELVFHETIFDHPQFDAPALAARVNIERLQGVDDLWFAGAWLGDGFHEAGLKSGLAAGLALGGRTPWRTADLPALHQNAQNVEIAEPSTNLEKVG